MSTSKGTFTIVGIDPGTHRTGFGVLEIGEGGKPKLLDHGCIVTPKTDTLPERLLTIQNDIASVLAEHQPDAIAIERLFFSRNVTSALDVSQARGVVLVTCQARELPIAEYTPPEIKQALTGHGNAPKEQVRGMVQRLLGLDFIPEPDDVSDAIAIALCHAHSAVWQEAIQKQHTR